MASDGGTADGSTREVPAAVGDAADSASDRSETGRPLCDPEFVFRLTVTGNGRVETDGPLSSSCDPRPAPTRTTTCIYSSCGAFSSNFHLRAQPSAGWVLEGWQGDCDATPDGRASTAPGNKMDFSCTATFVEAGAKQGDAGTDLARD